MLDRTPEAIEYGVIANATSNRNVSQVSKPLPLTNYALSFLSSKRRHCLVVSEALNDAVKCVLQLIWQSRCFLFHSSIVLKCISYLLRSGVPTFLGSILLDFARHTMGPLPSRQASGPPGEATPRRGESRALWSTD